MVVQISGFQADIMLVYRPMSSGFTLIYHAVICHRTLISLKQVMFPTSVHCYWPDCMQNLPFVAPTHPLLAVYLIFGFLMAETVSGLYGIVITIQNENASLPEPVTCKYTKFSK